MTCIHWRIKYKFIPAIRRSLYNWTDHGYIKEANQLLNYIIKWAYLTDRSCAISTAAATHKQRLTKQKYNPRSTITIKNWTGNDDSAAGTQASGIRSHKLCVFMLWRSLLLICKFSLYRLSCLMLLDTDSIAFPLKASVGHMHICVIRFCPCPAGPWLLCWGTVSRITPHNSSRASVTLDLGSAFCNLWWHSVSWTKLIISLACLSVHILFYYADFTDRNLCPGLLSSPVESPPVVCPGHV